MTAALDWISNFLYAAILAGVPLLFGTLGEILTEKAGNINLGVEGMMYMGAVFGFMGAYYLDSAIATLLFAFLGGLGGALVLCLPHRYLKGKPERCRAYLDHLRHWPGKPAGHQYDQRLRFRRCHGFRRHEGLFPSHGHGRVDSHSLSRQATV